MSTHLFQKMPRGVKGSICRLVEMRIICRRPFLEDLTPAIGMRDMRLLLQSCRRRSQGGAVSNKAKPLRPPETLCLFADGRRCACR